MKQEILKLIKDKHPKAHAHYVRSHEHYVDWLQQTFPGYPLATQLKLLRLGHSYNPVCANCNGPLQNVDKKTCSVKCREELKQKTDANKLAVKRRQDTNLKRYGVDNPAKLGSVQEARVSTLKKKYGTGASPKAIEATRNRARDKKLQAKARQTLQARYGVDNPGQLPDHRSKCIATMQKNYGVSTWNQIEKYRDTVTKTKNTKWAAQFPSDVALISIKAGTTGNPNDRLQVKCNVCNQVEIIPTETAKWRIAKTGTPCKKCSGVNSGSLKETALAEYIESLGVEIQRNNRTILNGKELDIVVPSKKIAFEFCGLFWHNDTRISKDYHLQKYLDTSAAGYRLITIFEDEWDYRNEQVRHRIKYALGLSPNRVYAKNTTVQHITLNQAREFLDKYHISGYSKSTHKLGLFSEDCQLIAVMTLSRPTRAKGAKHTDSDIWEIARFASSINVVGGASKLFKFFVQTHDPDGVFSYSDLRWGEGESYRHLGMIRQKNTSPGYWYISKSKRLHRYSLRKTKDEPKDKTEYELRLSQGYYRIWDCGHAKWVWTKEESGTSPDSL
jgi:hypothetical protein